MKQNGKNKKNIKRPGQGTNEFNKGYQTGISLVKYDNADSHNILNTLKNSLCQLLKIHEINGVGFEVLRAASIEDGCVLNCSAV